MGPGTLLAVGIIGSALILATAFHADRKAKEAASEAEIRRAVSIATVAQRSTLTEDEVMQQLRNFMTLQDKLSVADLLCWFSDWELVQLVSDQTAWKELYARKSLSSVERAILDEFLEDLWNICSMEDMKGELVALEA